MNINKHYEQTIGSSQEAFIEFIKQNNQKSNLTDDDVKDIDYLVQRVAQNLFYYEDNVSTAKSDFISLVGLLLKKEVIFEETKLQKVKPVKDDSGHWYVLPNELVKEFYKDEQDEDFVDGGDFDEKYGQYMTGGDLNLVQLYAKI